MSESVNLKVVIFWSIFIFIFAGLGIFGAMNQDLLQEQAPDVFVPVVQSNNTKKCSATLERGNIEYLFSLDENNNIKNTRITYNAVNGIVDDYISADTLAKMGVLGIDSTIQNDITNFTLMLFVNNSNLDIQNLQTYKPNYEQLNIAIESITNVEEYSILLNSKYQSIICE
jgi:hypothetical protein